MLVLTRNLGEQIVIGEEIVITVVAATRGRIRVRIEAPPEVSVHRREVQERRNRARRPVGLPR